MKRKYFFVWIITAVSSIIFYVAFHYIYSIEFPTRGQGILTYYIPEPDATKTPIVPGHDFIMPGKPELIPTIPGQATTPAEPTASPVPMPSPGDNTCNNPLVLIDKTYGMSANYVPPDLVELASYGIRVNSASPVGRQIMMDDLVRLSKDSVAADIDLIAVSIYRSYTHQQSVYNYYVQQYGEATANTFSAKPGHSQHQLGTAVDFSTGEIGYDLTTAFADTKAGKWLLANAHKYGFAIAYPAGGEEESGYQFEPWHLRYLGVDNAQKLQQSGLTMQKYLEQEGVRPNC